MLRGAAQQPQALDAAEPAEHVCRHQHRRCSIKLLVNSSESHKLGNPYCIRSSSSSSTSALKRTCSSRRL